MNDLGAALGVSQLSRLDNSSAADIANRYNANLSAKYLKLPEQLNGTYSSYHLYPIRLSADASISQKELYQACRDRGILVNLHYIPVYRHPYYEALGFKEGYCSEAERYHQDALSIPVFPTLEASDQDFVIDTLRVGEMKLALGTLNLV